MHTARGWCQGPGSPFPPSWLPGAGRAQAPALGNRKYPDVRLSLHPGRPDGLWVQFPGLLRSETLNPIPGPLGRTEEQEQPGRVPSSLRKGRTGAGSGPQALAPNLR